jgi:hypothetical protein
MKAESYQREAIEGAIKQQKDQFTDALQNDLDVLGKRDEELTRIKQYGLTEKDDEKERYRKIKQNGNMFDDEDVTQMQTTSSITYQSSEHAMTDEPSSVEEVVEIEEK